MMYMPSNRKTPILNDYVISEYFFVFLCSIKRVYVVFHLNTYFHKVHDTIIGTLVYVIMTVEYNHDNMPHISQISGAGMVCYFCFSASKLCYTLRLKCKSEIVQSANKLLNAAVVLANAIFIILVHIYSQFITHIHNSGDQNSITIWPIVCCTAHIYI